MDEEELIEKIKEHAEKQAELKRKRREPKRSTDKIFVLDGFLRVIYEGSYYEEVCALNTWDEIEKVSFEDILKRAGIENIKNTKGVIYIWLDDARYGEIWEYGNSKTELWHFHGETKGYY